MEIKNPPFLFRCSYHAFGERVDAWKPKLGPNEALGLDDALVPGVGDAEHPSNESARNHDPRASQ